MRLGLFAGSARNQQQAGRDGDGGFDHVPRLARGMPAAWMIPAWILASGEIRSDGTVVPNSARFSPG